MPELDAILVAGYKSFAAPTTFELRPLTLLYGRNNAGKSALLRLVPILASSVAADAPTPFVLTERAGRDAHYREILWKGQAHRRLELGLRWRQGTAVVATDRFTLDYVDELDRVIVKRIEVLDATGELLLRAEAQPYPDQDQYTIRMSEQEIERTLSFSGLVLDAPPDELPPLQQQVERLKRLRKSVLWLESVRTHTGGLIKKPSAPHRVLAPDGRDAVEVLLTSNEILEEVASWYREEVDRDLEIREVSHPHHRVVLRPRQAPAAWDIDIAHTGEGMVQVLPVLVGAALARRKTQRFLAVEEPESHLHPDAQKALARHLARLAASDDPPTVVVETHSRILLLGVQLAVAQGILPPERVCAYWVDMEPDGSSHATQARFARNGKLIDWPRSALSEDLALARELLELELQELD